MAPIELVVFDCDGTLVDSEVLAQRVQVQIGAELGWPLTEADVLEQFMGRSAAAAGAMIEARLGRRAVRKWDKRFRELHAALVDAELVEIEGVSAALAAIPQPKCVASSNGHRAIRHMLGVTGLDGHFGDRIFSATDVAHGKPAPDVFLHAAASLGFEPAACAVVEDSRAGVEAARAAGMRCFGYSGGLTPAAWLEGPGTVVFDDMRKLPELLAGASAD
jgi:HAD superfamily hydrolase (TIGR01509 family)